jgi:hypothetical protein
MALDYRNSDNHGDSVNRRRALAKMAWTGAGVLYMASGGIPHSLTLFARAETTAGTGQVELTIPIIVKYELILLAHGARRRAQGRSGSRG